MNFQHKTRKDLIRELQELQMEHDSLKVSCKKDITERKKLEEALPEPEILYRELIDLARDVIFSLTPKGLFGSLNQAFEKITGWQTHEWIGKPFTDLLHPEDIPLAVERFSNILKGHTAQAIELRIQKKFGNYACIEVLASSQMKKGMIIGLLGIGRDITWRKQVEEALKFTRFSLDNTTDTMAIIDYDGRYIDVNNAFCRSVGYSREKLLSMTVHDIDPLYTAAVWPEFMEKLKQAGSLTFESLHRTKEGKIIPVEINVSYFEHNGKEYHCGFARDITERKQAEEALRESEMKMKTLFEVLPIGVSILDAERNVVFVNPALETILNITKDGFIRGDYKNRKYIRPDGTQMPEKEFASVRAFMERQAVYNVETGVVMEDGNVIWTNVTAAPFAFPDWKVVIITTDISNRKQAEEALKNLLSLTEATLESIHNGILVISLQRTVIKTNAKFAEMWRIPGDILDSGDDKILLDYVYSQLADPDAFNAKVEELYEKPEAESFDLIYFKDGRIFERISRPMCLGGEPKGRVWSFLDITERKQAEEALQESEERFRQLYQQAPLGYQSLEGEGCFVDINQAWLDLMGYSRDEVIGHWFGDFLAPQEVDAFRQRFQCFKAAGEVHVDLEMVQRTGSKIIVHIDGKTGHDENGQFKQTHCILHDITWRKQAEAALRLEKENFRHSLDDSPLGLRIVTAEGDTIYANQTILNYYGYDSLEELRKTPLKDRYTPESYLQAQERKRQRESGDLSATEYEISIVRKDGGIRRLQVFRKEILWDGARQFQVICNDITEARRAELENQVIYEITRGVSTTSNLDELLKLIHHSLMKVVYAENCFVALHNQETGLFSFPYFVDKHDPVPLPASLEKSCTAYVFRTKRPMLISQEIFDNLKEQNEIELIGSPSPSWIGIPLEAPTGIIGVLVLQHYEKENVYSEDDVKFLYSSGNHIAIAIQRKQAEEALRESEERFRNLSSISNEGIMIQEGGVILEANKAFTDLVGYNDPARLIGKKGMEVFPFTPGSEQIIQKLLRSGSTENYDINLIGHDGRIILCETSGCNIIVRGRTARLVRMQDITKREQAEEEIRKSKKLLEDLHKHLNEILENERALISREIHDQIGQSLTVLKLDLNWIRKYINTNPEAVAKLKDMIDLVSNTIKDVQRISSDLRPGILDDLGLVSAIEWYCDEFEKRTGIKCNLKLDDSDYSDSQINLTFFRVLQEILTNVIRHAKASSVNIKLQKQNKGITMTIKDDGIGIPEEKLRSVKSLGLISMRERVKQFNGTIDISSKKDNGTKLVIFIPS